jgi:hypothetical protein
MNIALVTAGLAHRSIQHTAASIKKHIIKPLKKVGRLDVFYHSWELPELTHSWTDEHKIRLSTNKFLEEFPEAKGYFSSQDEFLKSIDFENFYSQLTSPLVTKFASPLKEKEITKSFLCYLKSMSLALDIMKKYSNNKSYDLIIFARFDILYLNSIQILPLKDRLLYIPDFHHYLGYNDRFAYGKSDAMDIYLARYSYLSEWLSKDDHSGTEKMLKFWLQKNQVNVRFFKLFFKRVRANGLIEKKDQKLVFNYYKNKVLNILKHFILPKPKN